MDTESRLEAARTEFSRSTVVLRSAMADAIAEVGVELAARCDAESIDDLGGALERLVSFCRTAPAFTPTNYLVYRCVKGLRELMPSLPSSDDVPTWLNGPIVRVVDEHRVRRDELRREIGDLELELHLARRDLKRRRRTGL